MKTSVAISPRSFFNLYRCAYCGHLIPAETIHEKWKPIKSRVINKVVSVAVIYVRSHLFQSTVATVSFELKPTLINPRESQVVVDKF